ncbi:hypothetical protein EPN29_12360 [bacterium]|nr:MAG: hypothetical protein EPN29_12360 [bacterium]
MPARLLEAAGHGGELALQGVDQAAQALGVDAALVAVMEFAHRERQLLKVCAPNPQHATMLPNIRLGSQEETPVNHEEIFRRAAVASSRPSP